MPDNNVSSFGLEMQLKASKIFPSGFTITEFPDDIDPYDIPGIEVADAAMGPNGHMPYWKRCTIKEIRIHVLADCPSNTNLLTLLNANRANLGKKPSDDNITLVITFPDNKGTVTLSNGIIISGNLINNSTAAGRFKSNEYLFKFRDYSESVPGGTTPGS